MKKISVVMLVVLSLALIFNVALFAETVKVTAKAPAMTVVRAVENVTVPAATFFDKVFSMEFVQNALQIILLTIIPLLLTGLGMIGAKVYTLIQSHINNIQSELGKKAAQKAFDVLRGIVDRIGATERKKLEAKLADGKLDKTEFKELMTGLGADALEEAKNTVGFKSLEQAKAEFADFESHMKNELEKYVESKKQSSPIILSAQPPTSSEPSTPSTVKAA